MSPTMRPIDSEITHKIRIVSLLAVCTSIFVFMLYRQSYWIGVVMEFLKSTKEEVDRPMLSQFVFVVALMTMTGIQFITSVLLIISDGLDLYFNKYYNRDDILFKPHRGSWILYMLASKIIILINCQKYEYDFNIVEKVYIGFGNVNVVLLYYLINGLVQPSKKTCQGEIGTFDFLERLFFNCGLDVGLLFYSVYDIMLLIPIE